jgi:hypothetical protein
MITSTFGGGVLGGLLASSGLSVLFDLRGVCLQLAGLNLLALPGSAFRPDPTTQQHFPVRTRRYCQGACL